MPSPAVSPDPNVQSQPVDTSRKPLEDLLGRVVGIATIVAFIAQGFGASLRTTAFVFTGAAIVFFVLHKLASHHPTIQNRVTNLPLGIPAIIGIALLCILGGMLLRQHYVDSYSLDVGELTDSFHWKLRWCRHGEKCIASAISSLAREVHPKDSSAGEELFADQVLSEIVRSSDESMNLLRKIYGAKNEFLAIGLAKPSDQHSFISGRIPEYLVPNYADSLDGVFVWKLEPRLEYEETKLYEVLRSTPPINKTQAQLDANVTNLSNRLVWNASLPAVVRFALIPKGEYSKCLGRSEAHEVFASHLGLMKANGFTVEEAARMSGYPLSKTGNDELYTFVFFPSHSGELNEATWSHIVSDVGTEVEKPSPCPPLSPASHEDAH